MHGESRRLLRGWCVKKCNFTCVCVLTKKLLEANLFARLSNVEMSGNAPESGLNLSCEGTGRGSSGSFKRGVDKKNLKLKTCILSTQNTCAWGTRRLAVSARCIRQ